MSECPGNTLEAFIQDELSIDVSTDPLAPAICRGVLPNGEPSSYVVISKQLWDMILITLEPYRSEVERLLNDYDDENSWRDYSGIVNGAIPEEVIDSIFNLYIKPYRITFTFHYAKLDISDDTCLIRGCPVVDIDKITVSGRNKEEAERAAYAQVNADFNANNDTRVLFIANESIINTTVFNYINQVIRSTLVSIDGLRSSSVNKSASRSHINENDSYLRAFSHIVAAKKCMLEASEKTFNDTCTSSLESVKVPDVPCPLPL